MALSLTTSRKYRSKSGGRKSSKTSKKSKRSRKSSKKSKRSRKSSKKTSKKSKRSKTSKKSKKSKKSTKIAGRKYITMDNGGYKFEVYVTKTTVTVVDYESKKFLAKFNYTKMFVGARGWSLLFGVGDNRYVYVCENVFSFTAKEPIVSFKGTLAGSSSVNAHVLTKSYLYLLTFAHKYAKISDVGKTGDPYTKYYSGRTSRTPNKLFKNYGVKIHVKRGR